MATIHLSTGPDTRLGTPFGDVMHGGPAPDPALDAAPDVLLGQAGEDALLGHGGDDVLVGGAGADTLWGGAGDDLLAGEDGYDTARIETPAGEAFQLLNLGRYGLVVTSSAGADTLVGVEYVYLGAEGEGMEINLSSLNPLFDGAFYSLAYRRTLDNGDASEAEWSYRYDLSSPETNYLSPEGRGNPNAFFDNQGYLAVHADVRAALLPAAFLPVDHYASFGWREGRDPSAAFDGGRYLALNPDVEAAGLNPLAHYLEYGRGEGRAVHAAVGREVAGGFDRQHYLMSNPDVARAGLDPQQHFRQSGWREGRDPNAFFDTDAYLEAQPDVRAAGLDPLGHYMSSGWREGRDPSPGFDGGAYLAAHADVAAAGMNPLDHYLRWGHHEGRQVTAADWH